MERYDFRTQRLFVDGALKEKATLDLDRTQSNYLLNVLRLKQGAEVLVFNGSDGEWLASVEPSGRRTANLKIIKQTRSQTSPYDLVYLFAPLKQARLDYMVQKAVEMGVGKFQPVFTHHTQVSRINLDRVKANIREAAEQCGILNIAECKEATKLPTLISNWQEERQILFCDEQAEDQSAIKTLQTLSDKPAALLIGPEGGFSNQERELLLSKSFVTPISLGPRILRADTAAVAALSIVQATIGDW